MVAIACESRRRVANVKEWWAGCEQRVVRFHLYVWTPINQARVLASSRRRAVEVCGGGDVSGVGRWTGR